MPQTAGVCEDDGELRATLRTALAREDIAVTCTSNARDAFSSFVASPPDVLVLDIGLPDGDGRDLCQALRGRGVASPVLFLSARDALPDRLSGFHAGGDDYLVKPFALTELVVRVGALLKRTRLSLGDPDGLVGLDPAAHAIVHDGTHVALTPTEFRLLAALVAQPGDVIRRQALVAVGWPDGAIVHHNTIDSYVARLRRKLRQAGSPAVIETARGVGYRVR